MSNQPKTDFEPILNGSIESGATQRIETDALRASNEIMLKQLAERALLATRILDTPELAVAANKLVELKTANHGPVVGGAKPVAPGLIGGRGFKITP